LKALQAKINEAEQERKTAKSQLVNAIQEGDLWMFEQI
jgi:hypothetical protein